MTYEDEELNLCEAYKWEDLRRQVRELNSTVNTYRDKSDFPTTDYDKLEVILYQLEDYINGRIEELNPGSYRYELSRRFYVDHTEQEAMSYAQQEGINYVALTLLPKESRIDAIDYIREHGMASLNYEETCLAAHEYEVSDYEAKHGIHWERPLPFYMTVNSDVLA